MSDPPLRWRVYELETVFLNDLAEIKKGSGFE